jgi:hypothetical protein
MRTLDDGLALLQVVLPEHLAAAIFDRLTKLAQQVIATRDEQDPVLSPDALDLGDDAVFLHHLAPDDPLRDDPALNDHHFDRDPLDAHVIFGGSDTFTTDPCIEHVPADERTLDQVRTDLLTDLLLASDPSETSGTGLDNIQARIQVTVAASTLAGDDDRPAELDGFGPLHPDVARGLAARASGWSRLFLDHTGMVTATDAYVPTEAMRRHLRARDQRCRFPGCHVPVHRCQIDHNHDHAKGGRTSNDNLSHFCPGHHALKHPDIHGRYRWAARQLPGGEIEWTSPIGRVYTDTAPRRVMFL